MPRWIIKFRVPKNRELCLPFFSCTIWMKLDILEININSIRLMSMSSTLYSDKAPAAKWKLTRTFWTIKMSVAIKDVLKKLLTRHRRIPKLSGILPKFCLSRPLEKWIDHWKLFVLDFFSASWNLEIDFDHFVHFLKLFLLLLRSMRLRTFRWTSCTFLRQFSMAFLKTLDLIWQMFTKDEKSLCCFLEIFFWKFGLSFFVYI